MWHADGKDMPACVPPDAGVVFTGAKIFATLTFDGRRQRIASALAIEGPDRTQVLNRIELINCRRVMHASSLLWLPVCCWEARTPANFYLQKLL